MMGMSCDMKCAWHGTMDEQQIFISELQVSKSNEVWVLGTIAFSKRWAMPFAA